jgi:hypothetical protein
MALKIMQFCGEVDPQARRYQSILESFFEALQEAEKADKQATSKASQTHDIFGMLFGKEPSKIGGGGPSAQTHNWMSEASVPPVAWADNQFPAPNGMGGLETLCFASRINGRAEDPSSLMDALSGGQCDNSIDGSDIWWNGGQDVFNTADDLQVPLYGLMEPT